MSEYENWFSVRFPNIQATIDQSNDQESKLLKLACKEVWQHQQAEIDDLRSQLNNMERCYIDVKKERDELQGKSQCIKNLVEQRSLAENMLRKISVAAQKKLPTFGAALRFNDEVKEILRGASD